MANQYHRGSEMDLVSGAEVPKADGKTSTSGEPIPMFLTCPYCGERHIAIQATIDVQFLRGFKDKPHAEVPEAKIEVSPEAIAAGIKEWHRTTRHMRQLSDALAAVYREMRRVELSRKEPTP